MPTPNKLDSNIADRVSKLMENESSMSTRTGIQLILEMVVDIYNTLNEINSHLQTQNGRIAKSESAIEELKNNSPYLWLKANKLKGTAIFIGIFAVNSMINWAGIRRPLLHAVLKQFGIDIPNDSLP